MRQAWRSAWRERSFRTAMYAAAVAAVFLAIGIPVFFEHIGAKPGTMPFDPYMMFRRPVDVTWLTFTVLYGGVVLAVGMALRFPFVIARGLHAYAILQVLRMVSMELYTFEPPPDIIPLIDPVTAVFYPGGVPFLKDLFFSGHTATLAMMVCLARGALVRWILVAATITVGALVILQHVHWTIDVLAAPVFVWLSWKVSAVTLQACGWNSRTAERSMESRKR